MEYIGKNTVVYGHVQLPNIIYLYTFGYINKESDVRAINRKGTSDNVAQNFHPVQCVRDVGVSWKFILQLH